MPRNPDATPLDKYIKALNEVASGGRQGTPTCKVVRRAWLRGGKTAPTGCAIRSLVNPVTGQTHEFARDGEYIPKLKLRPSTMNHLNQTVPIVNITVQQVGGPDFQYAGATLESRHGIRLPAAVSTADPYTKIPQNFWVQLGLPIMEATQANVDAWNATYPNHPAPLVIDPNPDDPANPILLATLSVGVSPESVVGSIPLQLHANPNFPFLPVGQVADDDMAFRSRDEDNNQRKTSTFSIYEIKCMLGSSIMPSVGVLGSRYLIRSGVRMSRLKTPNARAFNVNMLPPGNMGPQPPPPPPPAADADADAADLFANLDAPLDFEREDVGDEDNDDDDDNDGGGLADGDVDIEGGEQDDPGFEPFDAADVPAEELLTGGRPAETVPDAAVVDDVLLTGVAQQFATNASGHSNSAWADGIFTGNDNSRTRLTRRDPSPELEDMI